MQDRCPARLGPGARRDAPYLRLPTGVMGVALIWLAFSPGTAAGSGWKGVCPARSSGALLAERLGTTRLRQAPMTVIIGMDPDKRSATIEVVDDRGRILAAGRHGTDKAGYAAMLAARRRYRERTWAVKSCNSRRQAHRPSAGPRRGDRAGVAGE